VENVNYSQGANRICEKISGRRTNEIGRRKYILDEGRRYGQKRNGKYRVIRKKET